MSETHLARKPTRAPRGAALSCKGWQQEAALRLLMNCVDPDVAARPERLAMRGTLRAAWDWEAFDGIVAALRALGPDQTLTIDAGRLAGVSQSTAGAPRVVIERADWSAAGHGVVMAADLAGGWGYVGTQSALPVAYEIYAAAARRHFGGTLAGRLVLCGGMGGLGGAHSLAATLCGAAFLGIDADPERIKRRVKTGYCEVMVNDLDEALRILKNAVRKREPASVGLIGNCAEVIPALAERGIVPDVASDFTPADTVTSRVPQASHPTGVGWADLGYIPTGLTAALAAELSHTNPDAYRERAFNSIAAEAQGLLALRALGCIVLDSGNRLFSIAAENGVAGAMLMSAPASLYLHDLVETGSALATVIALSGQPSDVARADRVLTELFPSDERLRNWIALAGRYVRYQGLPARACWLSSAQAALLARALNQGVASGELRGPMVIASGIEFSESPAWVWRESDGTNGQALVLDGTAPV